MSRKETLYKAVAEEAKRRTAIFKEFKQLFEIYVAYINTVTDKIELKINIQNKIAALHGLVGNFTKSCKNLSDSTWPFKTNKNQEILKCANQFIEKHGFVESWDRLLTIYPMEQHEKTILGFKHNDYKGTSTINCIQTALYITIEALGGLSELQNHNIYNPQTSPLVQTTNLPNGAEHNYLYSSFKKSIFFYQDELSPPQGELLFFTLGYSFGGSRPDPRHHIKELRTEDCSSSIAKWVNSDCAFTTSTMKLLFEDNCQQDQCCNHIQTKLRPLGTTLLLAEPGDIYVFQKSAHMGIVTEIFNSTCFESLSYTRDIPNKEGLGYDIECITTRDYLLFSYHDDQNGEL